MFKENKINLFIMVKFTRRKMKNPLHVDNKKNTLLLKRLNEKINVMQLENKIKILNEDIKNEEEIRDYKGKYKRYNELWKNKSKYRDYKTITEEEEGGYIYLGYYAQYGWGVDPQGECRCYYIFKIGQTQDCVKCRISKQHLTKILAIKVKDAKKVETAILNRCYNKNIERCRGSRGRGWKPDPFGEKIHGREWFATKWTPDAFEKMKKELVEIVNDTIDYWEKIAVEIQQLKEKEYYVWRKNKNGKYKRYKTNWWYHYQEEVRISKNLSKIKKYE